jgi:hypothetical protein
MRWTGRRQLLCSRYGRDGVTTLAAMVALHLRAFTLTDPVAKIPDGIPPQIGRRVQWGLMVTVWLLLGLLAIPYWFALFFFNAGLFRPGFWAALPGDPFLILALLYVLASNVVEEFRRGYEGAGTRQRKPQPRLTAAHEHELGTMACVRPDRAADPR